VGVKNSSVTASILGGNVRSVTLYSLMADCFCMICLEGDILWTCDSRHTRHTRHVHLQFKPYAFSRGPYLFVAFTMQDTQVRMCII